MTVQIFLWRCEKWMSQVPLLPFIAADHDLDLHDNGPLVAAFRLVEYSKRPLLDLD